jgi:glycosyltransferase involved in cell wall biosynthesis
MGGTQKAHVDRFHEELANQGYLKKVLIKLLPLPLINGLKDWKLIRHDRLAAQRLKSAIVEFQPDLVYERNEYMQDQGTLLCRKLGIRHFLEVNSPAVQEMREFEGPSILHFWGHKKEKRKLKNTTKIFAVSSALKDFLNERYLITDEVVVIPNCINPEKWQRDEKKLQNLKQKFGLDGKRVIGFVGSIFPYHGVDKLILAFEQLRKEVDDCKLLIVGGGILREKLEMLAAEILPEDSFIFTGKVPHAEVFDYINLFDIAVMPDSNWYGSPVKVLEYGLMKKVIVAPDNGPLRDIIVNGEEGILVGKSIEELTRGLTKAINEPKISLNMAFKFNQKIAEKFTWKKQAEKILSYF